MNTFRCDNTDAGPTSSATTASRSALDRRPGNRSPLCPAVSIPSVTDLGDRPRSSSSACQRGNNSPSKLVCRFTGLVARAATLRARFPTNPASASARSICADRFENNSSTPSGIPARPPPRQPTRPISFGFDGVTPGDRFGRRSHPAVDRRRVQMVTDQGGVQPLGPALGVAHLHHVGDQHMIMNIRIPRPARPMPGLRPHQPPGRRAPLGHPTATPHPQHHPLQIRHRRRRLRVHDGVHVIGPAHHPQDRDRLPGAHHQLDSGSRGGSQALPRHRIPRTPRTEYQPIGLAVDRARQTQAGRPTSTPDQRRLPTAAVIRQRLPRMVIAPGQHRLRVIRHRLRPHRPHPRHRTRQPRRHSPQGGDTLQSRSPLIRVFLSQVWYSLDRLLSSVQANVTHWSRSVNRHRSSQVVEIV